MNILHLARSILAGAPVLLSNFLNKYGKDINSRCITTRNTSNLKWKQDILWPWIKEDGKKEIKEDFKQLEELLDWASIIVIHNQPPINSNNERGWKLLGKINKPVIVQIHSEPNKVYKMIRDMQKHFKISEIICIAQYQTVFCELPHKTVRNVIDINLPLLQSIETQHKTPFVTYSPSNKTTLEELKRKRGSDWAYKSFYEVEPILKKLRSEEIINYMIFHEHDYEHTLKVRQNGDIHIDDIYTGSYHLSSLEGLSQGKATICNLKDWMIDVLKSHTGCKWVPWVIVDKNNLENTLKHLACNRDQLERIKKRSREWIEEFWNPQLVLNDHIKIYEEVL